MTTAVPERSTYQEALGRLRASVLRPVDEVRRTQIDRSVGLLAGRVGCRLEEAHAYLVRVASDQDRELSDTATAVIELLETASPADSAAATQTTTALDAALRAGPGRRVPWSIGEPVRAEAPPPAGAADALAARLRDDVRTAVDAGAVVLLAAAPDGSLRLVAHAGLPASDVPHWRRIPLDASTAAAAVRSRRALWRSVVRRNSHHLAEHRTERPWPARAWLPVRAGDRVVGVIGVLWPTSRSLDAATRQAVSRVTAKARRGFRRLLTARDAAEEAAGAPGGWLRTVQEVLDTVPGSVVLLSPVRDDGGRVVDFVMAAASSEAVDSTGRRAAELTGLRVRETYSNVDSAVWTAYLEVLGTGQPRQIDSINRPAVVDGEPRPSSFSVRVHRLGDHLLVSWVRRDADTRQAEWITQTERLGNLGWGQWDLTSGEVEWSEGLYHIFERDPALGPMPSEESDALALPEDEPIRRAGAEAFARGERLDMVYRLRINGRIKHLRAVVDAVRGADGQPVKVYGILQDVTARETARARLAEVERQLDEQRRSLAAEHRLASQLQQIILPVPDAPVELPGMRVAVRYLPAEHLSRVGGDWYHAGPLPGGPVLLAIGDVAGHGIPAATTMARMRHALSALTVTTTDPAELMSYLNQLLCGLAGETPAATATAVIARYDPAAASLTWAQAGHPPPLLFTAAGATEPLPRPAGPLLGVMEDAVYETATVRFRPGDVLLLYTDGLVEHRSLTLEEGLASVISSVDEAIASAPDQPLAALLARLPRANPNDDTCLLAARPTVTNRGSDG